MYLELIFNIGGSTSNLMKKKKLEVFRYDLKATQRKVKKKSKVKEQDFETNQLKIAYATARTICSYHIDNKELFLDFVSSLTSQINVINNDSTDNYLLLSTDRLSRLRDFSQSTRTGELAQAINYLFVQEVLDYPYIIDYHLFCKRLELNVNGVSPDFIILNKDLLSIGLFESKGEAAKSDNITTKLNNAIEQLDYAKHELLVRKKIFADPLYPVCTKFQFEEPTKSSINYVEIKSNSSKDFEPIDIYKRHYASWFYLIGDFKRANELNEGNKIASIGDESNDRYTYDEKRGIYWVNSILPDQILNDDFFLIGFAFQKNLNTSIRLGIRKLNVTPLITETLTDNLKSIEFQEDDNLIWFKDGTVIEFNKNSSK